MTYVREPKPRQKKSGSCVVRWAGKEWYLGRSIDDAEKKWLDPDGKNPGARVHWQRWALRRPSKSTPTKTLILAELADLFLESLAIEGRDGAVVYYRKHMGRFLAAHGRTPLIRLSTPDPSKGIYAPPVVRLLDALRLDMVSVGFAPKTIRHDLGAVSRLLSWGAGMGHCQAVSFAALPTIHVPRSEPDPMTPRGLRLVYRAILHREPDLAHWIALQYLCCCRPTDTGRLIRFAHGRDPAIGRWIRVGDHRRSVIELREHKTAHKGYRRFVVLSREARLHLRLAPPRWARLDGYSAACTRGGLVSGPSVLRDSSASHLRALGAAEEDIRLALGHRPPGVLPTYAQAPLALLLETVSELSLA